MSKKVKSLIEKETAARLQGIDAVGVLNPRGLGAIANNHMRRRFREKKLRMTVVKNTLAARATAGTKLKGFERLLDGRCPQRPGRKAWRHSQGDRREGWRGACGRSHSGTGGVNERIYGIGLAVLTAPHCGIKTGSM